MESDLQSLFGLHVYSFTHLLRPRNPPPRIWAHIREGAIGQPREATSLFVTPWAHGIPLYVPPKIHLN